MLSSWEKNFTLNSTLAISWSDLLICIPAATISILVMKSHMLAGIRKKKPSAPLSSADDVEIQKMAYQNREKFQLLDRKHFEIMIKD